MQSYELNSGEPKYKRKFPQWASKPDYSSNEFALWKFYCFYFEKTLKYNERNLLMSVNILSGRYHTYLRIGRIA